MPAQTTDLKITESKKSLKLINSNNLKEHHLGIKKLHLNRKGNNVFGKNLLKIIEGY